MNQNLQGHIALVTGASRGIGAAIATTLAQHGATVIGTATSQSGADRISQALAPFGGVGKVLQIAEPNSIENLVAAVMQEHGAVSILVNNAAITRDNLLLRMGLQDWDEVLHINLQSVFRTSRAVMRAMVKARRGRIINITSMVGTMGNAGQSNYAAAKAGLIGFSKSLAQEIGARGITVNCVAPGFIETDMTSQLSEQTRASCIAQTPLGRLGTPQDIANAVLFLASEQASFITGQTLHVNGGMLMP